MEKWDKGEFRMEGVSDKELGFDFLSKQTISDSHGGTEDGLTEQCLDVEEAGDGFLTTILIDRKIKLIETCPPAPRKPPPPPLSTKRKALFPMDQSAIVAEIAKLLHEKKARVLTAPATVV